MLLKVWVTVRSCISSNFMRQVASGKKVSRTWQLQSPRLEGQ